MSIDHIKDLLIGFGFNQETIEKEFSEIFQESDPSKLEPNQLREIFAEYVQSRLLELKTTLSSFDKN